MVNLWLFISVTRWYSLTMNRVFKTRHFSRWRRKTELTNKGDLWFFVFDFQKNERANISAEEKEALQTIAQDLLSRTGKELGSGLID